MKFRLFINSIMLAALALSGAESDFIRQGKTDYVIVISDQPDVGNQFASSGYLKITHYFRLKIALETDAD